MLKWLRRPADALRGRARRGFNRCQAVRELAAAARWPKLRRDAADLAHLTFLTERMGGPVQRDEALFLHSLVRVVQPRTIVEIGFFRGDSAFNFLRALNPDARLYSFDIDPACEELALERLGHDPRFVFRTRSQAELTPEDVEGHLAEFVFLDAAHELGLNQATFERLVPLMASDAIVAIHDTGTVPRRLLPPRHWAHSMREGWVGDEYEVRSDERAFVNWLLENHAEFSQIHLHSRRVARCGLTLLQRATPLARPPGA